MGIVYRNGAFCWIDEQTVLQFKTIQMVVKLFSRILLFRHRIHNLESKESFLWLQSCSKPCLPFPGGGGELPLTIHLLQQAENWPKQNFEQNKRFSNSRLTIAGIRINSGSWLVQALKGPCGGRGGGGVTLFLILSSHQFVNIFLCIETVSVIRRHKLQR